MLNFFKNTDSLLKTRDIIRDSFLGVAVLTLMISEIMTLLPKENSTGKISFIIVLVLACTFIVAWLLALVIKYTSELIAKSGPVRFIITVLIIITIEITFFFSLYNVISRH